MRVFENQEFADFSDRNSGRTFANLEFRRCRFVGSFVSFAKHPRHRSTIRNVQLIKCEAIGCALEAAIVEEVLIDGLTFNDTLLVWGAVFKHVTLRGTIGPLMLNYLVDLDNPTSKRQRAFDEANAAYYATVDWALDIREAEFADDPDIRSVPAHLIRRDPETQVVIKRENVLDGHWRHLGISETTHWPTAIEFFLEQGQDDVVLVAPKRAPDFQQLLEGLQTLRTAGIAEPD
jgi:hypothetical protein